jgi:hypothetical protein
MCAVVVVSCSLTEPCGKLVLRPDWGAPFPELDEPAVRRERPPGHVWAASHGRTMLKYMLRRLIFLARPTRHKLLYYAKQMLVEGAPGVARLLTARGRCLPFIA